MKDLLAPSAVLIVAVALGFSSPVVADDTGSTVYKAGLKSTCFVYTPKLGSGSGSLIDVQKRLVITNNHVVGTADFVIVHFPIRDKTGKVLSDKDRYIENITANKGIRAKVLAREELRDLAVIQLDRLPEGVHAVKLAPSSPEAGEDVHSIGCPGASDAFWVYTKGNVRQVYEKKWTAGGGEETSNHKARIIEATSQTTHGDSGGPAFNSKGEQVGVTQGGLNALKAQGYSFFIDVSEVKNFLRDRKITLSARKDDADSTTTEVVTAPKTDPKTTPDSDPMTSPKIDPKPDPKKKDPPKVTADDLLEKRASSELSLMRSLIKDPNKREVAIEKLKALIKKYPKTSAAEEAARILKALDQ